MFTSYHQNRHPSTCAFVYAMGLLVALTLCIVDGRSALAQEPTQQLEGTAEHQEQVPGRGQHPAAAAYDEEEFGRQWKEVQEKYPLVARAFAYLQLHAFCGNLDQMCFVRIQDQCLKAGVRPKICQDQAKQFCCKPLVVFEDRR